MSLNLVAQEKITKYSFSVYLSNGTISASCLEIKKADVSPLVYFQFDSSEELFLLIEISLQNLLERLILES